MTCEIRQEVSDLSQINSDTTHLEFVDDFNQSLVGFQFPPSIVSITFYSDYDQPIVGVQWPPRLECLDFQHKFNQPLQGVVFPDSLQVLVLDDAYDQPLQGVQWPASLRLLWYAGNHSIDDVALPAQLRYLLFRCGRFNRPIDKVQWPSTLKFISFYESAFNQPLANLPPTVERLVIGDAFRHWQSLRGAWPPALTHLFCGNGFNERVQTLQLPDTLTHLNLGNEFDQPLTQVQWPASLRLLRLGVAFSHSLIGVRFPRALEVLKVDDDYFDEHSDYLQTLPFAVVPSEEDDNQDFCLLDTFPATDANIFG